MGNVTIQRLGEEAQRDNFMNDGQLDPPVSTRLRPQEILAWGLAAGVIALVLFLVLAAVKGVACWDVTEFNPAAGCTFASGLLWFYVSALVLAVIAVPVVLLWGRIQRTNVEVYRGRITRGRYDEPLDTLAVMNKTPQQVWAEFQLLTQESVVTAPYRQLYSLPRGLDAFTMPGAGSGTGTPPSPALTDAGPTALAIVPVEQWLPWLTHEMTPHQLLIAKTRGGKSTLADIILKFRAERGDQIAILDRTGQPRTSMGTKSGVALPQRRERRNSWPRCSKRSRRSTMTASGAWRSLPTTQSSPLRRASSLSRC